MGKRVLLSVGAVLGLVLTTVGAFAPAPHSPPAGAVALVNGKPVPTSELTLALARLYGDDAASLEQRAETLNYLIDQELLVQRGIEIGLLESDHTIRKAVAMATIDAIVAEVLAQEPAEDEVRTFYQSHVSVFSTPARLHLQHLFCDSAIGVEEARACAERTREDLSRGMGLSEVRERYGASVVTAFPDALTPLSVVRRVLGPTLSDAVEALHVGEVAVVPTAGGSAVFRLVDKQEEQPQPYETVQSEVRAEYLRRRRDETLQRSLTRWQSEASLVLSPKALQMRMIGEGEY
ncbi:MAG: peptidyl-prolyl cis-trans isomerase [Deltaproteobacteria bacterium]|nr:peptidyl-prolyl cis-trans isomerase [Deltaproteobacteria bacterium]